MPPKKKVAGLIKLQIQAGAGQPGAARRARRWASTASTSWSSARPTTPRPSPARQRHPGRDHGLRGPLVHFITKTPPAAELILKAAGVREGLRRTRTRPRSATITKAQVREIAETKMADLNANDVEAAMKIIEGTARSMGVTVTD